MTTLERIEAELKNRFEASSFEPITVEMKCNGDKIEIIPCGYFAEITSFDQIDWYLMHSQVVNFCGGSKLSDIAKVLNNYQEYLEEDAKALESLKAHIRKYGKDSDWDFVSDYHKDIFGHRPHVGVDQIIKWANSDSKKSARYFPREWA